MKIYLAGHGHKFEGTLFENVLHCSGGGEVFNVLCSLVSTSMENYC